MCNSRIRFYNKEGRGAGQAPGAVLPHVSRARHFNYSQRSENVKCPNMTNKIFRVALIGLLISTTVNAKKTRRIKPKPEEDTSPKPSVVSYSTFGFNDVGSYDGFVPSSPDYVNYLSNANQDSTPTRLYAPAFPSSLETSGFGSQTQEGQATGIVEDNNAQPSILQYNSASYYNPINLDHNEDNGQNDSPEEKYKQIVDEESNSPIYGTKLGRNKNKNKYLNQFNDTASFNVYSSGPSSPSENKYLNFKEAEPTQNKPTSYGESANTIRNVFNYAPTYPPTEIGDEVVKPTSNNTISFNFPKVIDFTKYKQYYPTEVEPQQRPQLQPLTFQSVTKKKKYENKQNKDSEIQSSSFKYPPQTYKNNYKVTEEDQEKEDPRPNVYTHHDYSNNFISYTTPKTITKSGKLNLEFKDKIKHNPWDSDSQLSSISYNSSNKNWRNPLKNYEYSTDYSNMSFKFDTSTLKKPFSSHSEEQASASNNLELYNNFPGTDYSSFKKIPGVKAHYEDDYSTIQSKYKDLFKSDDYINQFKNLYGNSAPTTSSIWGNVKEPEFLSHQHHSFSSPFRDDDKHHSLSYPFKGDEITNDVVHIPKKPYSHKFSSSKYSDRKPSEWLYQNKPRPQKLNNPNDWTKDVSLTRFKSEEDLLGLRTHDTSHPSYLPSYKPFHDVSDEFDYMKLVEKWKQSYLQSKYKETLRDFETYASDAKPVHVPIPKPYASDNFMYLISQQKAFKRMRIGKAGTTRRALIFSPAVGGKMMRVRPREIMKLNTRARYRPRRPLRATYQDRNRRRWPERRPEFRGPSNPYRSTFDDQEYRRRSTGPTLQGRREVLV
ncbi:hypothetical protein MSG28_007602 [Choristoneura fumiferana]|uniref:Uncharacterized protein n=2 Tax=Choristoneura fumiferana TaxID=7141 RepID=A0ACC0JY31_CHOFU|nr:hypothetical protein MSG28_007602 [Choristoneura fumiferana]